MTEEFDNIMEEIGEAVPKYCPGCGSVLVNRSGTRFWIMPYSTAKPPYTKKDGVAVLPVNGFDVYCNECEWSGDIEPDSLEIYNEIKEKQFL